MKRDPVVTSMIMSRIKFKDTGPELAMGLALSSLALGLRRQVKAPGTPDFWLKSKKIAVFVDGDFWHGNTWRLKGLSSFDEELSLYDDFWKKKISRNVERDGEVDAALKAAGWKVFRFWESDVKKDALACAKKVRAYMKRKGYVS